MKRAPLVRAVLVVNSAGFLAYLAWLTLREEKIFYAQDGVFYLLPCIPFIFVYAFLAHARRRDREGAEENT